MSGAFVPCRARRRALCVCVASACALAAPLAAIADTWTVVNCTDDPLSGDMGAKTGSLRFALAHAASPATIDLSGLTGANACVDYTISLAAANGQLVTTLAEVTLQGPGFSKLNIDASGLGTGGIGDYRVIRSNGSKLTISGLTLTGGRVYHYSYASVGGCIFASGELSISSSVVTDCRAEAGGASSYQPEGGAIYALGTVTLTGSTVSNSKVTGNGADALGGGIFAAGTLTLQGSTVHYNTASSNTHDAKGGNVHAVGAATITSSTIAHGSATSTTARGLGGGLYAVDDANLALSIVSSNSAIGKTNGQGGGIYAHNGLQIDKVFLGDNFSNATTGTSRGGGAQVKGTFLAQYSAISGNDSLNGSAGGVRALGNSTTIKASTVSGNTAKSFAGLAVYGGEGVGSVFELSNSTVSGNTSEFSGGAFTAYSDTVRFYNTTIAFNRSGNGTPPGAILSPFAGGMALAMQSTLIGSNSNNIDDVDLFVVDPAKLTINGGDLATPAHNLVRSPGSGVQALLPADTKTATINDDACPHLQALRNNGGLTWTHRPMSNSPALDAGGNPKNYTTDQRGTLAVNGKRTYARISSQPGVAQPKPDIGAHEVEQDDVIFGTDLEGCNGLP